MSFTRMGQLKVRDIKPRCHRCGKNGRSVRPTTAPLGTVTVDLCADCRKSTRLLMTPEERATIEREGSDR